jgi:hypothetical protein
MMRQNNQGGATLFEITSVMAIVLLLITILLIGQKVTLNIQVNRLERDFNSIEATIFDAHNRLRPMKIISHDAPSNLLVSTADSNNSNWNAIIDGSWNSTSGDTFNVWQNVLDAGLPQGSTNKNLKAYVPLKPSGSVIDISEASSAPIAELKGNYIICSSNVDGSLVKQLDLVIDDGNTASGSMMVSNTIGGAAITTYGIVNSNSYTVCMGV